MSGGRDLDARPILVTGGGGGLARALAACAWPGGRPVLAPSRQALDICDATQAEAVIASVRPAAIINTAAYTKVDLAEGEPAALGVNDRGCEVLSGAAARTGVRLLHVSSDFVFSGGLGRPYHEMDATGPVNAYGRSKLRGERHVLASDSDAVVVRTSWLLGGPAGFIPAILGRARQGVALEVVGDQVGTPTGVDDFAVALRDIALRMIDGGATRRLYHVAGQDEATWHDIAVATAEAWAGLTGAKAPTIRRITSADWGAAAARPVDSRLNSSAFQADFGYGLPSWRSRMADWVTTFERNQA